MHSYLFESVLDSFLCSDVSDLVEFNLSYDYRSSRWLAVSVTKVESALAVSKEQFTGQILIRAEPQEKFKVGISLSALWHDSGLQSTFLFIMHAI